MQYRISGVDGITKKRRDSLILEADSEQAARAAATSLGMQVEEVQTIPPRSVGTTSAPPPTGQAGGPIPSSRHQSALLFSVLGWVVALGALVVLLIGPRGSEGLPLLMIPALLLLIPAGVLWLNGVVQGCLVLWEVWGDTGQSLKRVPFPGMTVTLKV